MDRKDYIEMLETKEDEWIGVLQGRRAQLEQEDIAEQASECEKERQRIHSLEKRLADIRAKKEELSKCGESTWEDLKKELEKKVEEFQCDVEEVVYYGDENTEPK